MARRPKQSPVLKRALAIAKGATKEADVAIRGAEGAIKSALRWARQVEKDALSEFRRASPVENVLLGFSPKARRYVKKGGRVTRRTRSISARQAETKRVKEQYGFASPEIATKAREGGALSYRNAQARETAQRTKDAAYLKKLHRQIEQAAERGERIPEHGKPTTKRIRKGRRTFEVHTGFRAQYRHADRVVDWRERKLAGETLDDGDWHMMMDYAERFKDPARHLLRASPGSFGLGGRLEDE